MPTVYSAEMLRKKKYKEGVTSHKEEIDRICKQLRREVRTVKRIKYSDFWVYKAEREKK